MASMIVFGLQGSKLIHIHPGSVSRGPSQVCMAVQGFDIQNGLFTNYYFGHINLFLTPSLSNFISEHMHAYSVL